MFPKEDNAPKGN